MSNDPGAIALSLIALVDGVPARTVNLIENDDSARPHLRPWLAALVVVPEFRRAGVGPALARGLAGHAACRVRSPTPATVVIPAKAGIQVAR